MFGSYNTPIVNSVQSTQFTRGPFGQSPSASTPHVSATHGPMSFAPQMYGASGTQQFSFQDASFMDMSEDTAQRLAALQAKLNKKLGPEFISQRPGPGGGPKLTYAEGWKIINLANEVFGFNGWSSSVVSLTTDFIDQNEESKRFTVGVTAIIRITLRDGVFHEDIGYGMLENSKSKGAALDKCKKEAVTDGVKRALRNFGNLLGNCLYDKSYTQEVIKIKVPPPKFDRGNLHRRPEFEEANPCIQPAVGSSVKAEPPLSSGHNVATASADLPHMRGIPGTTHSSMPPPIAASTPDAKGNEPMRSTGLQTPIRTPVGPQAPARTGPSHIQPARNPPPPPPQNPPPSVQKRPEPQERRVAFAAAPVSAPPPPLPEVAAEKASVEEDEFDAFYPDDDAFLAAVDLGEGDEGLGRPIDFDEGTGGVNVSAEGGSDAGTEASGDSARAVAQERQEQPPPPAQQPPPQRLSQKQPQARPPQPPQAVVPPPQQSRASFVPESTMHKPQASGSSSNQNIPPQSHTGTSASAGAGARTSQGGFHFPPGGNAQSSRAANAPGPSSSGIGQKRGADVMRGQSAAPVRRPGQGMGLANPTPVGSVPVGGAGWPMPQLNAAKREPLSALEVGEGGDVKRVRR